MPKRFRILFTIPNFDSAGSGKVVYDLVKHIDRSKFDPQICCKHNKGAFFKQVETLGVPIHIFNFSMPYKPLYSLPLRVWKIRNFLLKNKIDVVHSWHWSSDFTEPLACKLAGIPFIYTKKAMGWGNRSWNWRSRLSKRIITINSDMEARFFSKMRSKTVQIPIGLNTNSFGILKKIKENKDGFTIKSNDFTIVSIANLVTVKGIEYLLEAVNMLNTYTIKVFIVGDDTSDYALNLKKTYQADNIIFTGKKQNINDYLALADLFVIPTKVIGEGQPIAPIEAMLSGRVVIGSNVPGTKDVLEPFPDLLFKPESVSALIEKIEHIMNMSVVKRDELASQLYAYASKRYNLNDSIVAHENLYLSLIQ